MTGMPLRVTQFGEPILQQRGERVTVFDAGLRQLAEDMIETMHAEDGIGLAAQQVDRAIQLCVVDVNLPDREPDFAYTLDGKTPPLDLIMPLVLVNPELELREPSADYEEGCLSFPDIRGLVNRPLALTCRYQDLDGHAHELVCDGLLARVIQHEVDHLHGILFIDRMERRQLMKIESKVKKLKRTTRDWLKAQKKG
ncbi:MAG: peptide deformylase [Opitutales bacterium]